MIEATETSPREARRRQAAEALNAVIAIVQGPRGAKKAAKVAAKAERKNDRKAKLMAMLSTEHLKVRVALTKTVVALKNGATVEELQACTALRSLTDWAKLVEPIGAFATAKGVDPTTLLAGLGCPVTATTPNQGTIKASSGSMDTPATTEAPKLPTEPKPPPKAPHGRHIKGRS
jgi:hypothetical protein